MRKVLSLLLLAALLVCSCGEGRRGVQYEVIGGNIFWAIFFLETVIAPILILGRALYEPIGEK